MSAGDTAVIVLVHEVGNQVLRVRQAGEVAGDGVQMALDFTVEIDGSDKPACVGESVGRAFVPPETRKIFCVP